MAIKKIKAKSPDPYLGKTTGDATLARIAHVNQLVDQINNNVSTSSYKVYTALLTQSGTNPPVATVLENTLGVSITWTYGSLGYYYTNDIVANINKVAIFCSQGSSPVSYSILSYANSSGPTVAFNIQTLANYTGAFIGAIGPNNGLLSNAFVEIRVYN